MTRDRADLSAVSLFVRIHISHKEHTKPFPPPACASGAGVEPRVPGHSRWEVHVAMQGHLLPMEAQLKF